MKLAEVSYFEFGEQYRLLSPTGSSVYAKLDDLLERMGDMFRLESYQYCPSVKVYKRAVGFTPSRRDPLGQESRVISTLRVTPVRLGLSAPDDWIKGIRKRVTHYNLSGSWDYFETENL